MRSKGTERPFGLEQEELFALVAFSFDLRHKFPDESRQKDFSVNLKKCVRERNRQSLQELGAFMHHLMNGLAKMKTPTEGLLYSHFVRIIEKSKSGKQRDNSVASHVLLSLTIDYRFSKEV